MGQGEGEVGQRKYITSQVMMEMYEFLWATTFFFHIG